MTDRTFAQEINSNPLVEALVEKTKAGKLNWEPTASDDTFIASVGGDTTLKLTLVSEDSFDNYGQPEVIRVPYLSMADAKGRTLWEIRSTEVKGGLYTLHKLAQRVANKVDERIDTLLETVQKL